MLWTYCQSLSISNNEHDWTAVKYLNVLHQNKTQKRLQHFFFLIYCKNIVRFLFWVLWKCLTTSIKNYYVNFQKLWCLSTCKRWTQSLPSFFRMCKDISSLLIWVLWECLIIYVISNDSITLKETFMMKVLKSTCWKLRWLSVCKTTLISFLRYCRDTANLPFWEFREYLTISIKIVVTICRIL